MSDGVIKSLERAFWSDARRFVHEGCHAEANDKVDSGKLPLQQIYTAKTTELNEQRREPPPPPQSKHTEARRTAPKSPRVIASQRSPARNRCVNAVRTTRTGRALANTGIGTTQRHATTPRRAGGRLMTREELQDYPPFIRAMEKISLAAATYDPGRAIVGLSAFDGAALTPSALGQQLHCSFGFRLSPRELGAICRYFDKDGDNTIDCGEFLSEFFKLGRERKRRDAQLRRRQQRRAAKRQQQQLDSWAGRFKSTAKSILAAFSEADLQRALHKIGAAAATYDRARGGLQGFDGAALTPRDFKLQLMATLRIKVSAAELSALVHFFDGDGDGVVDCGEFTNKFFKLGRLEKAREAAVRKQREMAAQRRQARVVRAATQRLGKQRELQVVWPEEARKARRRPGHELHRHQHDDVATATCIASASANEPEPAVAADDRE